MNVIEPKTEKVLVKGPYYPNNSYIVLRRILNGDITSNVKVVSRETRGKAKLFADQLCLHRNLIFGGFEVAGFMEKEPR